MDADLLKIYTAAANQQCELLERFAVIGLSAVMDHAKGEEVQAITEFELHDIKIKLDAAERAVDHVFAEIAIRECLKYQHPDFVRSEALTHTFAVDGGEGVLNAISERLDRRFSMGIWAK